MRAAELCGGVEGLRSCCGCCSPSVRRVLQRELGTAGHATHCCVQHWRGDVSGDRGEIPTF